MAIQNIPLTGALEIAGGQQTALAASKLRFITGSFTPGPNDTLAALEALETTFSGYTAGGYELTTWLPPAFANAGGAQIISPQINAVWTAPGEGSPVQAIVSGWFLVDAGGNLVADGQFTTPQFMGVAGDAFTATLALLFGTTSALVQIWVDGVMQ